MSGTVGSANGFLVPSGISSQKNEQTKVLASILLAKSVSCSASIHHRKMEIAPMEQTENCNGRDDQRLGLELMIRFRNDDPSAFQDIYDFLIDRVFCFLNNKTGERHIAEDLSQATFLKLYQVLSSRQTKVEHLSSYCMTIASNIVMSYFRERFRKSKHNGDQIDWFEYNSVNDYYDPSLPIWEEEFELVQKAIDALSARDRTVLQQYFWENLTPSQIAKQIGTSDRRVRQLIQEVLRRLRLKVSASQEVSSRSLASEG